MSKLLCAARLCLDIMFVILCTLCGWGLWAAGVPYAYGAVITFAFAGMCAGLIIYNIVAVSEAGAE